MKGSLYMHINKHQKEIISKLQIFLTETLIYYKMYLYIIIQTFNFNRSQNQILSNIRTISIFIDFFNLCKFILTSTSIIVVEKIKLPLRGGIVYFTGRKFCREKVSRVSKITKFFVLTFANDILCTPNSAKNNFCDQRKKCTSRGINFVTRQKKIKEPNVRI